MNPMPTSNSRLSTLDSQLPRIRRSVLALTGFLAIQLLAAADPSATNAFFRFPAIHANTILFTSEGDLWQVGVKGGTARRLTTHPGTEAHAAISPDGLWVAFTAEYEGPTEVYAMPLAGGLPKRLTFEGGGVRVVGWTPDRQVLYASTAYATLPAIQLASVDPLTGLQRLLPLAQASEGAFTSDRTLIFTRLPKQNSNTKRYRGGWIENLWRFRDGDPEAVPLTADFDGTSRNPMIWKDRLCFVSDRDGSMNLWSMRLDGSQLRQHTHHRDFDVKHASLDAGRVVYQLGADLWLHDLDRGTDRRLEITLVSDFDQRRERWIRKPLDYLTAVHPSPNGDRIVLTSRGQVFVAPARQGRLVELPRKADVRYRDAQFLPDGKSLVALSDETGELEFWQFAANGLAAPHPLTTNGTVFRSHARPSPDGHWLAWGDQDQRLWIHDLRKPETQLVAESAEDPITDFSWSPDSQWLAYVLTVTNTYRQIILFRVSDGTRIAATSDRVDSFSPAWSPDGRWLAFLSDRQLRSLVPGPWGKRQPEPHFTETTRLYLLGLRAGLRSPFQADDELMPKTKESASPKSTNAPKTGEKSAPRTQHSAPSSESKPSTPDLPSTNAPAATVVIETDQLATRLEEVPVPAGNYDNLTMGSKYLVWTARDTGFDAKTHLKQLEIKNEDPKAKTLVEDVASYEPTSDDKKLLVRKGDAFHLIAADAAAPAKLDDTRVSLDGWALPLDPREEWRQIYTEAWRMLRDFFYDRAMHGLDWNAVHRKYLPLVDRVNDRAELGAILAEMTSELSALHTFVRYGDEREGSDQVKTATLGARLTPKPESGGWQIEHIYQSDPDYPALRSPLAVPEVAAHPGDILEHINGRDVLSVPHPEALLRNQAGRQVLLGLRSAPTNDVRSVIASPITSERDAELRYHEWEYTRRLQVEQIGQGQIGYVHLRAMGADDMSAWAREFYPIFKRPGLIVDVRNNRGGNIDSWLLGRLLRKAWFYWQPRVGNPTWNMHYAFRGHLVVLCNQHTASDGEAFAEGFRRLNLGTIIGTRTWGGEIWLSARRWLVDNGMATAAETGVFAPEGDWLIEGHGVDPDIVVDNLPHATFRGLDAQLETALQHLQDLIARDPRPIPPTPKYPDKRPREP